MTFLNILGHQDDIKDLTFDELVQLGRDTLQIRPHDVKQEDVSFYLFTRTSSDVKLDYETPSNMTNPVKFIIHGFIENHSRKWYKTMTDEYLKRGDYNVIQVDWERPSRSNYVSSAYNTKFVGTLSKLRSHSINIVYN